VSIRRFELVPGVIVRVELSSDGKLAELKFDHDNSTWLGTTNEADKPYIEALFPTEQAEKAKEVGL